MPRTSTRASPTRSLRAFFPTTRCNAFRPKSPRNTSALLPGPAMSRSCRNCGPKLLFSHRDLLSLRPIREGLSLIVCKNVLLHFDEAQRINVLQMFHQALQPGGTLVMEAHAKAARDACDSLPASRPLRPGFSQTGLCGWGASRGEQPVPRAPGTAGRPARPPTTPRAPRTRHRRQVALRLNPDTMYPRSAARAPEQPRPSLPTFCPPFASHLLLPTFHFLPFTSYPN